MDRHALANVTLLLIASVACFSVGRILGTTYTERRYQQEHYAFASSILENEVSEIAIGQPFPDFRVRSLFSDTSCYTSELLPRGGVLLFVAADAAGIHNVLGSLRAVIANRGTGTPNIVILSAGDDAEYLRQEIVMSGLQLPLFLDHADYLRTGCNVPTGSVYFIIDTMQTVRTLGYTGFASQDLLRIVESACLRKG